MTYTLRQLTNKQWRLFCNGKYSTSFDMSSMFDSEPLFRHLNIPHESAFVSKEEFEAMHIHHLKEIIKEKYPEEFV